MAEVAAIEVAATVIEVAATAIEEVAATEAEEMTVEILEEMTMEVAVAEMTAEMIEEMTAETIEETTAEMTEETTEATAVVEMIEATAEETIEMMIEEIKATAEETRTLKIEIEEAGMVEATTLMNLLIMNFACSDLKTRIDIITRKRYSTLFSISFIHSFVFYILFFYNYSNIFQLLFNSFSINSII